MGEHKAADAMGSGRSGSAAEIHLPSDPQATRIGRSHVLAFANIRSAPEGRPETSTGTRARPFWGLFRARAANVVLPALPGEASGDLEVLLGKAACVVARQLDDDLAPTHLQVGVMAFRFG